MNATMRLVEKLRRMLRSPERRLKCSTNTHQSFARAHNDTHTNPHCRIGGLSSYRAAIWLSQIALLGLAGTAHAQIPGTLPGSFAVSQTGEATYSVPIFTPEATGGLAPDLALAYGHRAGDGYLGMRWDIAGIRAIQRCPRTFAQDGSHLGVWDHGQSDRFCLEGERMIATSGTYGASNTQYRFERDTFERIVSVGNISGSPEHFYIDHGNGLRSYFGNTADSRFNLSPTDARPEAWYLSHIQDQFGNRINFFYTKTVTTSHREIVPDRIEWSANPGLGHTARYRAQFTWQNRPAADQRVGWAYGKRHDTTKRLQRVTVSFNSQEIHRYNVAYTTPASTGTKRSQVASIQMCRVSTCLPATTFEWQDGIEGWNAQTNTGRTSEGHEHVRIGDFTGNGQDDLFVPISVSGTLRWHVIPASNGTLGTPINTGQAAPSPEHTRIIDYNGDGRADLLVPGTGSTWLIYQSTGSLSAGQQFTVIDTQRAAILPAGGPFGPQWQVMVMDFDADGLADIVYVDSGLKWYRNTGNGFATAATLSISSVAGTVDPASIRMAPPDVNGDGRPEITGTETVFVNGFLEINRVLLTSTPNGFAVAQHLDDFLFSSNPRWLDLSGDGASALVHTDHTQSNWMLRGSQGGLLGNPAATGIAKTTGSPERAIVADFDGDGREDLIIPDGNQLRIYRATATGLNSTSVNFASSGAGSATVRTADITGNGVRDILVATGGTWRIHTHKTALADVVTKITDGLGNETAITHEPISTSAAYSQTGETPSLPNVRLVQKPIHVVTAHSITDGIGGTAGFTHAYVGARWHNRGYGFLGFRSMRTTDTRNGVVQHTRYRQDWPFTGLVDLEETHQSASGPLIHKADHTWNKQSWSHTGQPQRHFLRKVGTNIEEHEVGGPLNGQLVRKIDITRTFDSTWGRLTQEVTSFKDASSFEVLRQEREVTSFHTVSTALSSSWCTALPNITEYRAIRGGTSQTRTEQTTYSTANCRLTDRRDTSHATTSLQHRTQFAYNTYGNLTTLTQSAVSGGPASRQTTFDYDSHHQSPTTETVVMTGSGESNLVVSRTWDHLLGVELTRTGVDGLTTSWQYDVFGRLTREDRPDGTHTQLAYATCGTCFAQHSQFRITATGSDGSEMISLRDRYGRAVGAQWKVATGDTARRELRLDEFGRVELESMPYLTGNPVYWIEHGYDLIGRQVSADRPISEAQPAGALSSMQYRGLEVWATDAENRLTKYEHNAAGELTKVTDALNGTVQYSYHPFGELHQVTDAESRLTTISIDARGLKTAMTEPSMGAWSYQYNVFGELASQTNALSQATTLTYDQAGRLRTRQEVEGTSTWTYYQSGTGTKGRLHTAVFQTGTQYQESHSYDALGRPTQLAMTLDGTSHLTNASYDSQGRLAELTYPTSTSGYRFKVQYQYDSSGHLSRAVNGLATTQTLWQRVEVDALGRDVVAQFGNGLFEERVADQASGHLKSAKVGTTSGGTNRMNLSYQWDKVGNLTSRSDLAQSKTETFSYDALHRLKTAHLNGTSTLSVNYSAGGRITSKSDVGSYTYGNVNKPYAVTAAGGASYGYDANGRMTSRGGAAITWYSYDLPKKIDYGTGGSAVSSEFFYGTGRARYKQLRRAGSSVISTIYYVGSLYERETAGSTTTHRHHIFAGGQAIGQMTRTQAGVNSFEYFHRDHQGSVTKVTNASGSVIQSLSYDAFGKRRNADWSTDTAGNRFNDSHFTKQGYTGHEHLDNVRLIHMNGRVQDPTLGRFISPDPHVPDPRRSQGFDRYGYVYNNPLKYTDPSGFFPAQLIRQADSFGAIEQLSNLQFKPVDNITVTAPRLRERLSGFADIPVGVQHIIEANGSLTFMYRDQAIVFAKSPRPTMGHRIQRSLRVVMHTLMDRTSVTLAVRGGVGPGGEAGVSFDFTTLSEAWSASLFAELSSGWGLTASATADFELLQLGPNIEGPLGATTRVCAGAGWLVCGTAGVLDGNVVSLTFSGGVGGGLSVSKMSSSSGLGGSAKMPLPGR